MEKYPKLLLMCCIRSVSSVNALFSFHHFKDPVIDFFFIKYLNCFRLKASAYYVTTHKSSLQALLLICQLKKTNNCERIAKSHRIAVKTANPILMIEMVN